VLSPPEGAAAWHSWRSAAATSTPTAAEASGALLIVEEHRDGVVAEVEEQEGAALVAVGWQIVLVEGGAVQLGLELPGGGQLLS